MKLEGEFTFSGPRNEVWDLVQDPEILVAALPGAKKMEKTAEDTYESTMQVRVGPVNGVFSSKIVLSDKVVPESYKMQVDGKGGPGFIKGTAIIKLSEQGENATLMQYSADLKVGGRLASVGQRLLDTVGKSMSKQSLEAMNQALQKRLEAQEKGEDKDKVDLSEVAPSEAEFAAEVAKDVAKDTFSRPGFWIVAIVAIAAIVYLVMGMGK